MLARKAPELRAAGASKRKLSILRVLVFDDIWSPPLCESREPFCYPRPLPRSQGGEWRVLWGADQPPPASFGPHSFELRILPPPVPPWIGVRVVIVPNPDRGLTLSLTFGGWGGTPGQQLPLCQKAAPSCSPELSRAGGSAKGPGAVRFRGKGPQVGAAAAECERFRWEITGDNSARDGAAQQETSSGEPAAGQGGGEPLGNRTAAGGTATERRAAALSLVSLLTALFLFRMLPRTPGL